MNLTNARILNVGCGSTTEGTDFIDLYPNRPGVLKHNADEGFPFDDCTFDQVYSKYLFEHLRNPGRFLDETYRVLKPGGKTVIITDHSGYWRNYLLKVHLEGLSKHGELDTHFAAFTPDHIIEHLQRAGFIDIISIPFRTPGMSKKLDRALSMIPRIKNIAAPNVYAEASKPGEKR